MVLFTNDSMEELSTMLPTTANISTENGTTFQPGPFVPNLFGFKIFLVIVGVVGMLTNGLVFVGFALAGRAKMNASSVYIVNHTTFEQSTTSCQVYTGDGKESSLFGFCSVRVL